MYKIFADDTLIYDSTLDQYRIGKGEITLELNKSGSFVFSLYPDHFFYDSFIKLKTVITVFKSDKIIFRGRLLNDVTDFWNNKVLTCEGELGFLQDSIIRKYFHSGTSAELFEKFIWDHNAQVDAFKQMKIGVVNINDNADHIIRHMSNYETTFNNISDNLLGDSPGGYIYITHDDSDVIPTINYVSTLDRYSTQIIEFGSNLKNYTKTVKCEDIATAIIPLGAEIEDEYDDIENSRLTIGLVNDDVDYVYNQEAVNKYGWIFKCVIWEDITDASELLAKAKEYVKTSSYQNITIDLTALDLHLFNSNIESFEIGKYIRVVSQPHNFDETMLCNKQTIDLLKPENDTVTLGYSYSTFTDRTSKSNSKAQAALQNNIKKLNDSINDVKNTASSAQDTANTANSNNKSLLVQMAQLGETVANNTEKLENASSESESINVNLADHETRISNLEARVLALESGGT